MGGAQVVIRSGLCFRKGPWQPKQRMDLSVDTPWAGRSLGRGEGYLSGWWWKEDEEGTLL